jgi:putative tricarboxylic transport membrane protein
MSVYAATYNPIGTAVRMGPGYFPLWVGGLVALLGALLLVQALRFDGPPLPRVHWHPLLLILVGGVAFGYLLKPLGLVLATAVLVIVSAGRGIA